MASLRTRQHEGLTAGRATRSGFKYVPQPMDTPAAAEYVVGDYTPNRAAVLGSDDYEEAKGNWVEDARDEIAKKLRQLWLIIATDNADASAGDKLFANDQRQRLYTEIQKGNTAMRFSDGYPTPAAIFNRARGKLRMSTDATDVTRFGGWNHQVSDFAAAALAAQNYNRGDRGQEFGSFAYSPLDPVAEYATGSRLYPAQTADVSATYAGRTSAAQGDTFYTGNVEAKVFWKASDVEMSDVRLTITDLEDTVNGDPLEFGYARAGSTPAGTVEVESLEWEADVTNDGVVKFNSSADVTVKVDTLSGDPVYRPVYGGQDLTTGTRVAGVGAVRYFTGNSGISQEVRISVTPNVLGAGSPDQDGPYWVLRTGPADETAVAGALTFWGIGTGRQVITRPGDLTTSGTAFDEAKAAFEAGQDSLAYPTHVVTSFSIETAAGASRNEAFILLFKDGSTFHYHGWTDHNADFIGSATEAASGYRSAHFEGNPLLSANDNALLFSEYGQSFTKAFPTKDGDDPATTIGVGAPTGGAAALAARWFRDNPQYVNVPTGDMTARDSKLEGMFVGQDQGGPLGIIGTWELTGGAFGIGDSTQDVRGAFGADIQP